VAMIFDFIKQTPSLDQPKDKVRPLLLHELKNFIVTWPESVYLLAVAPSSKLDS
jgi:hypothetical protein